MEGFMVILLLKWVFIAIIMLKYTNF
jgi:hypothetical protein